MVDSHTHLHLCDPPDAELVAAAGEAGVRRILTVAIDDASCAAVLDAAHAHPSVFAAIGRHPNTADDFDVDVLRPFAADPRCVAIGETGFDYHHRSTQPAQQRRAFIEQIELARDLGKPLVIHTREADDDTLALLRDRAGGLRVVLHCFSMAGRVDECVAEGWWISFAGNVTFPKAADLAAAAERVPADRLLVETDAPFLTPVPRRGRPNQPASVVHTARFVAGRRGVSYEDFERDVDRCAADLFGW
ncbi:MAG TPA: TatD family hydrolase [Solirubrobacteraceae bacterium]|nr:TatD family hydrolase [Solirubrobacteraceae bacterium]